MENDYKSDSFLTNTEGNKLIDKMKKSLERDKNSIDCLVGFFQFDGLSEIREHIKKMKKIQILIGMGTEKGTTKAIEESEKIRQASDDFYSKFIEDFNKNSKYWKTNEAKETFKIFCEKVTKKEIEVRQSKEKCHAKLYIFNDNDIEYSEIFLGSSNFTHNGLCENQELNVWIKDKDKIKDAKRLFDLKWEDAEGNPLIENDNPKWQTFKKEIEQELGIEDEKIFPKPYLMYLRVLWEYFKDCTREIKTPAIITAGSKIKYSDFKYQTDAVKMAIEAIEKHNGVILSDVVGLGKSIVAATVASNLNKPTIYIAPPHLEDDWRDKYIKDFQLSNLEFFSSGKIEYALNFKKDKNENKEWLIIIDEAHNYRNNKTEDWQNLSELCQDSKVMLLTATPFNNNPNDIFSLLRLFQNPKKSTILPENRNLEIEFKELIKEYKELNKTEDTIEERKTKQPQIDKKINDISNKIREIIEPVNIRRSRLDLKAIEDYKVDLNEEQIKIPEVIGPIELDYKLENLTEIYSTTLDKISNGFQAVRYNPLAYVKNPDDSEKIEKQIKEQNPKIRIELLKDGQKNMAEFIRLFLVRRFESSQEAFKKSMNDMLEKYDNTKKWINKYNSIPIYKKGNLPNVEKLDGDNNKDIDNEIYEANVVEKLKNKGLIEISIEFFDKKKFLDELDKDIELLKGIKKDWENICEDPKLLQFKKELKNKLSNNNKIIVFSQFADTINYLEENLKEMPIIACTSENKSQKIKQIEAEFDANATENKQTDKFKILLATDALSEGVSLHRANTIFNFDIPYNPTKVIQRIGRINRIKGMKFTEIFIYNYFPTEIGEMESGTKRISTMKKKMIDAIFGEDTKALTTEEELKNFFPEQYEKFNQEKKEASWRTIFINDFNKSQNSPEMEHAKQLPLRTNLRIKSKENKVLIFKNMRFSMIENANDKNIEFKDGFKLLKENSSKEFFDVSSQFNQNYESIVEKLSISLAVNSKKNTKYGNLQQEVIDIIDRNESFKNLREYVINDKFSYKQLEEIIELGKQSPEKLQDKINFYLDGLGRQFELFEENDDLIFMQELSDV